MGQTHILNQGGTSIAEIEKQAQHFSLLLLSLSVLALPFPSPAYVRDVPYPPAPLLSEPQQTLQSAASLLLFVLVTAWTLCTFLPRGAGILMKPALISLERGFTRSIGVVNNAGSDGCIVF